MPFEVYADLNCLKHYLKKNKKYIKTTTTTTNKQDHKQQDLIVLLPLDYRHRQSTLEGQVYVQQKLDR